MFLLAVKNTLKYVAVTVPVTLAAAILLSVVLQNTVKGVRIFQLSFLYPLILPIASVVLGVQSVFGDAVFLNTSAAFLGTVPFVFPGVFSDIIF